MSGSTAKHGEPKKQRAVWTTSDAWENLDKLAREFMLSRSELIEMIGQGRLKVIRDDQSEKAA
jgi:hypothetical protein